jgi:hypothetical protein
LLNFLFAGQKIMAARWASDMKPDFDKEAAHSPLESSASGETVNTNLTFSPVPPNHLINQIPKLDGPNGQPSVLSLRMAKMARIKCLSCPNEDHLATECPSLAQEDFHFQKLLTFSAQLRDMSKELESLNERVSQATLQEAVRIVREHPLIKVLFRHFTPDYQTDS